MKDKEPTTFVGARIPVGLVRKIDESARESSRTRSAEIIETLKLKYDRRPKK